MLKKIFYQVMLIIWLFQIETTARAETQFNGVDLNPVVLGCLLSGGTCLDNTGIPILDKLFGGKDAPLIHQRSPQEIHHYFNSSEYWTKNGDGECFRVKKNFWLKKNPAPPAYHEETWIRDFLSQRQNRGAFDCTGKQKEIFIKLKIKGLI